MACRDLLAHPAVMDEMELKETRATQGDKGDNGSARLASYMNWKECVWKKTRRQGFRRNLRKSRHFSP